MTDMNWDDMKVESSFVSWENVGDTVSGTVVAVRPGTDFNGNPCPLIDLSTEDGERSVTCGQFDLKRQIVALRPGVGDTLTITFSGEEKMPKGMKKVFTIEHLNPLASLGATPVKDEEPGF